MSSKSRRAFLVTAGIAIPSALSLSRTSSSAPPIMAPRKMMATRQEVQHHVSRHNCRPRGRSNSAQTEGMSNFRITACPGSAV